MTRNSIENVNRLSIAKKYVNRSSPCMYSREYSCTPIDTVVTSTIIMAVRPSTYWPSWISNPLPIGAHDIEDCTASIGPLAKVYQPIPRAMTQATTMAASPISEPLRGISLPNAAIRMDAAKGRATITHA